LINLIFNLVYSRFGYAYHDEPAYRSFITLLRLWDVLTWMIRLSALLARPVLDFVSALRQISIFGHPSIDCIYEFCLMTFAAFDRSLQKIGDLCWIFSRVHPPFTGHGHGFSYNFCLLYCSYSGIAPVRLTKSPGMYCAPGVMLFLKWPVSVLRLMVSKKNWLLRVLQFDSSDREVVGVT
jgi:hypothetical protein